MRLGLIGFCFHERSIRSSLDAHSWRCRWGTWATWAPFSWYKCGRCVYIPSVSFCQHASRYQPEPCPASVCVSAWGGMPGVHQEVHQDRIRKCTGIASGSAPGNASGSASGSHPEVHQEVQLGEQHGGGLLNFVKDPCAVTQARAGHVPMLHVSLHVAGVCAIGAALSIVALYSQAVLEMRCFSETIQSHLTTY